MVLFWWHHMALTAQKPGDASARSFLLHYAVEAYVALHCVT